VIRYSFLDAPSGVDLVYNVVNSTRHCIFVYRSLWSLCSSKRIENLRKSHQLGLSHNIHPSEHLHYVELFSLVAVKNDAFCCWPRRVYVTVRCRSVCLSVCLFQHRPTAANPLLQVCCSRPGEQEISISCCPARAGSVTLLAYVVAEYRLVLVDM